MSILRRLALMRSKGTKFPYKFDLQTICPELAPELTRLVQWQRTASNTLAGDTASRFRSMPGAHKWLHYFAIYDELFSVLRTKPINLLEIGVYKGASTQVWQQFFHSESKIVGIDINPECAQFDNPANNLHVRIGPQQDQAFLAGIVAEFGPFDLIIDDGSHIPSHMIASFNHLFDPGLKDEGLYFVEDTHTNFWPDYRDSDRSFMDFSFGLVECMHAHYSVGFGEHRFRVDGSEGLPAIKVPRITTLIEEIRFLDSVVTIKKSAQRTLPQSQHW